MKRSLRANGFAAVEILLVVAVVALLGFLGYTYYTKSQQTASTNASSTNQARVATDTPATAPAVNSTADLDNAEKVLDSTDPSGSNTADAGTLDTQVASF